MAFLDIFNLCLLSIDLIGIIWLFILAKRYKRKTRELETALTNRNYAIEHLHVCLQSAHDEIEKYKSLCKGSNSLKVESAPFCYQLVAERNDKKFVIKRFNYITWDDKEEVDFCRRQAEELKEIIEKF